MAPVPQPPDLPDDLLPHVVAYIRALEATIAQLTAQVRGLTAQVAELIARLNQNSTNSSKPPSSDAPHVNPAPPKGWGSKSSGYQAVKFPTKSRQVLAVGLVVRSFVLIWGNVAQR
ncbi:hypothetical protein GobsT_34140 [Gemmata obscuriglobus]|nr:hypothetical protein GobsT_34140 [Gemmata obscuriglobus]VTS06818.1 Transposase, is66 family protein OS=Myxococcus fulvus (strain ATCC BAA-855 / HW-1) GN=LILAB_17260 PE=4 SV=1 [Gemmata obscuriglobus UQM 2246]